MNHSGSTVTATVSAVEVEDTEKDSSDVYQDGCYHIDNSFNPHVKRHDSGLRLKFEFGDNMEGKKKKKGEGYALRMFVSMWCPMPVPFW